MTYVGDYPILVRRFSGEQSMVVVCQDCAAEMVLLPDQLLNDGFYVCPDGCRGAAVYKYEEADSCRGCQRLGFWHDSGGCCSRRCRLQVEYAEQLRSRRNETSVALAADAPGSALWRGPAGGHLSQGTE